MVPAIRNILGGFLFSGDDVYKKASVLSGGERTRLAVARMLLIPSNTLLLDEPTNHLDLDSKDILLEALEDYGGTLIFVSHDRYFVEKLATKIVEIGHGGATVYPGTYKEFLYSKQQREKPPVVASSSRTETAAQKVRLKADTTERQPAVDHAERKRQAAEQRKRDQAVKKVQTRISDLEARIAEREQAMKEIEAAMSAPGFYENRDQAQPLIDRHQSLMWELGELMHQWEELQRTNYSPDRVNDDNVISTLSNCARILAGTRVYGLLGSMQPGMAFAPSGALTGPWRARIPLDCRSLQNP